MNVGVEAESQALPYDDAREMVEEGKSFQVMDCICRKEARILGKGCDHTLENCLLISSDEDAFDLFYWGRSITKQEALEIVENAEKEGLVHTTLNYANDSMRNLCNCCSCACFQLHIINNLDQLNGLARSQFNAQIDSALCDQEGACAEACPVDAISEGENAYCVDLERCIGCGVCVTACPTHAVSMVLKPEDARTTPPNSLGHWMVERLKERGSSIDEVL